VNRIWVDILREWTRIILILRATFGGKRAGKRVPQWQFPCLINFVPRNIHSSSWGQSFFTLLMSEIGCFEFMMVRINCQVLLRLSCSRTAAVEQLFQIWMSLWISTDIYLVGSASGVPWTIPHSPAPVKREYRGLGMVRGGRPKEIPRSCITHLVYCRYAGQLCSRDVGQVSFEFPRTGFFPHSVVPEIINKGF